MTQSDLPRPPIVVLCGNAEAIESFEEIGRQESEKGKIVLVPYHFYAPGQVVNYQVQRAMDQLQLDRIVLADEVLVLNIGGHIDERTGNEMAYAYAKQKHITTVEPLDLAQWFKDWDAQLRAESLKYVQGGLRREEIPST